MADVAAEAHVSVKTVSRVVKGENGVRPDTANRVRAVIDRLGFGRADGGFRAPPGRSLTIGLIVEDLDNPFYSQIGAAVEHEARVRHHLLITASAQGSPSRERSILDGLIARGVDGLVVVPAGEAPSSDPGVVASGIPIVYVDRPVRGAAADTVLSDNAGGIRSAMEHLVAHGHQRVGFLGDDPEFWTARQRRIAFEANHTSLGLPGTAHVAMGPHRREDLRDRLSAWVGEKEPITAIITGNNRVTIAALHAMRDIGAQLSLVGYDDFELAGLMDPPITVVHQDPKSLGQKAAQQLFLRLLGDESEPQTVVVPTRLIVRGSGRRRSCRANLATSPALESTS
ncbi:MAG: LacI family DNA-binding transcriptional regulator [Dermatophilaceae bacterium]